MLFKAAPELRSKRLTIVRGTDPTVSELEALIEGVRRGLTATPRTLPCEFFYDQEGSDLFERICGLPEYYLTRTEDALLRTHADAMVTGFASEPAMIELGSGSASKTRRLIGAALARYEGLHYVPIDVSSTALIASAQGLVRQFPTLRVTGYVSTYQGALDSLASHIPGPRLWVFLGSSLGNYLPRDAVRLLGQLAGAMDPEDRLLLGTDMAKDSATLEAAYDDAQGVTAQFNRNLLIRINRELGADFNLDRFHHRAVYRPDRERVEMHLVSQTEQVVRIPRASLTVRFAAGESIHTENSHKYTPERLADLATSAGFAEESAWTDAQGLFRLQRWRPAS